MPINYIVNDPAASNSQARTPQAVTASPDRPATGVGFKVQQLPPEKAYPVTSREFVAWQAREAALRTLDVFENIATPLKGWTGQAAKKKLSLNYDDGEDLNAYYDRNSVSFFHYPASKMFYSGASADVVAHEVGHAILDALRPDLWNVQMIEVAAFHEGFGDCIAVMLALSDRATRNAVLTITPNLDKGNFAEATAEDLSQGIRLAAGPTHNAAAPRRALNAFQWAFPQSLPENGKPGVLINEIHSFGQLTSGCYYDLIREIYQAGPKGEAALWQACRTATALLAKAVADAPVRPRFLESVGRTMILADRDLNPAAGGTGGQNEAHIRAAFERHGISLSVSNYFAPRAMLATGRRKGARLSTEARTQLFSILEVAPDAAMTVRSYGLQRADTAHVAVQRPVDLTGLSERLRNVKAYTPQETLVGPAGGTQAMLGAVDPGIVISNEVRSYVKLLLDRGQIAFDEPAPKTRRTGGRKKPPKGGAGYGGYKGRPTHVVRKSGDEVVLERIGFSCTCLRCRLGSTLEEGLSLLDENAGLVL